MRVVPLVALAVLAGVLIALVTHEAEPLAMPPSASWDALEPLADTPPASELRGRVLDPGGRPLAGALVAARAGERLVFDRSDTGGRFRLHGIGSEPVQVQVLAAGHVPLSTRADPSAGPAELRLERPIPPPPVVPAGPTAPLHGHVVGTPTAQRDGPEAPPVAERWAGYELALLPAAPPEELGLALPRRLALPADGRFALEDLPHGRYRALLLPPWAAGGGWPDLLAPLGAPGSITFEHPLGSGLRLEPRAGLVRGQILDAPRADGTRLGVAGALLLLHAPGAAGEAPRFWPPATSDETGAFLIGDLPPGRYFLLVRAGEGRIERELTVEPGPPLELELQLEE